MAGILKNLKGSEIKLAKGLDRGLQAAGEFVKKESLSMTPKEHGALQASIYGGYSYPIKHFMNQSYAEVGYDKTIAPYAAQVHEEVGKHLGRGTARWGEGAEGNMWDDTGEPKFLEKAFFRNVTKIKKIIQGKIKL